jgi:hypothetical protein
MATLKRDRVARRSRSEEVVPLSSLLSTPILALAAFTSGTMTTVANGASAKGKKAAVAATPAKETAPAMESTTEIVKLGGGKPDLNHHHSQLDLIKADIDKTTKELVSSAKLQVG